MPWCDDCSKFWNAPELGVGRTCPSCGRVLAPVGGGEAGEGGDGQITPTPGETTSLARAKGAPWHFKLMVFGVTVYMIYRILLVHRVAPKAHLSPLVEIAALSGCVPRRQRRLSVNC